LIITIIINTENGTDGTVNIVTCVYDEFVFNRSGVNESRAVDWHASGTPQQDHAIQLPCGSYTPLLRCPVSTPRVLLA